MDIRFITWKPLSILIGREPVIERPTGSRWDGRPAAENNPTVTVPIVRSSKCWDIRSTSDSGGYWRHPERQHEPRAGGMTLYTADTLALFLEKVRASNLPSTAKTQAGQLVAGAIALSAKVQALEAELAKLRQQRVNETVNQPSSKKPEWDKGNGADPEKPTRKRKLGGPRRGSGNRPKTNPEPDRSVHNPLQQCPKCQADLTGTPPADDVNKRIVEDIEPPADKTVVTEETSERKWCPNCQQIVSAKSELALPRSDIGLHATVRIVYLWVVAALSLPNIPKYLSTFMRLGISTSGISNLLIRVAAILAPVAEEILRDVRQGFQVWADETGWRVRGINWWLWAFANETSAYFYAAPNRGSPVVVHILGTVFAGVLITDAWGAYNAVDCLFRQTCMAHVFRKISGGSMAPRGAQAYAILISIAQTCHLRKISFPSFLLASLRHYCRTGKPLLLSQYASLIGQLTAAA